jgi:hypothetical protein
VVVVVTVVDVVVVVVMVAVALELASVSGGVTSETRCAAGLSGGVGRKRRKTTRREKRKPTVMDVAQKSVCRMSQVVGSDGLASSGAESGEAADSGSFMSPGGEISSWLLRPARVNSEPLSLRSDCRLGLGQARGVEGVLRFFSG